MGLIISLALFVIGWVIAFVAMVLHSKDAKRLPEEYYISAFPRRRLTLDGYKRLWKINKVPYVLLAWGILLSLIPVIVIITVYN